jgi:hypothetical protein
MDMVALKSWVSRIEVESDINKLEIGQILKVVSERFAKLVAQDPSNLYKLFHPLPANQLRKGLILENGEFDFFKI